MTVINTQAMKLLNIHQRVLLLNSVTWHILSPILRLQKILSTLSIYAKWTQNVPDILLLVSLNNYVVS